MSATDTIYALASGAGRAGVAVIRVSGPVAEAAAATLAGALPPARTAALRTLRGADGTLLDRALVLSFPHGASFTGEAVVELHCHGGRAVVRAVMDALAGTGCRLAEPGEFTLRAFRNGRMDLAEVEALADLVDAETEAQRRQAMRGVSGALRKVADRWRERLIRAAALVEVTIDWADEEVPENTAPEVEGLLAAVSSDISAALAVADGAERLREGFEVALVGAPNAGKSSLLNALAGREAAITSPEAGTTRDVVELRYDLDGLPVIFLDMAGLRVAEGAVEAIGIARATERAEAADLRLILEAPDAPAPEGVAALARQGDLRVRTKADLGGSRGDLAVSAATGEGVPALLAAIAERLADRAPPDGLVAHRRQRLALEAGLAHIEAARKGLDRRGAEEVSEDIRGALRALERLIGRVGVEDLLGEIFGRFCLGK